MDQEPYFLEHLSLICLFKNFWCENRKVQLGHWNGLSFSSYFFMQLFMWNSKDATDEQFVLQLGQLKGLLIDSSVFLIGSFLKDTSFVQLNFVERPSPVNITTFGVEAAETKKYYFTIELTNYRLTKFSIQPYLLLNHKSKIINFIMITILYYILLYV